MGAVGDEHLVPALASTSMVSLNDAQSGPFAVGARRRLQAHPVHPGQRQQGTLQLPHQPQGALRTPGRVIWVQIGEVVEPGDGLVDRRIELHGAGAERVDTLVQTVVHPAESAKMPCHLRFAEGRDFRGAFAPERGWHDFVKRPLRDAGCGEAWTRMLGLAELK